MFSNEDNLTVIIYHKEFNASAESHHPRHPVQSRWLDIKLIVYANFTHILRTSQNTATTLTTCT